MINIQNILITKLKHIGDVLLAGPVCDALHQRYPDAKICMLIPRGTEEVLANSPSIHEVILFDRAIKRFGILSLIQEEWNLLRRLRSHRFDLVVELGDGDRGAFLSYLTGARLRLGYCRRKGFYFRDRLFTHVTDHLFDKSVLESHADVLRPLGFSGLLPDPRMWVSESTRREGQAFLEGLGIGPRERLLVFHPTSRWMFKSWGASQCAGLADWIATHWEGRVLLTCARQEKELKKIREITSRIRESVVDISGKTSLSLLSAILERSSAFVGVDSAPMHMAYALGIPTLSLFGPSDPVQWAPRGSKHRVLSKRWACQPCQSDGCLGSKVSQCLTELTVEDVVEVLEDWLLSVVDAPETRKVS